MPAGRTSSNGKFSTWLNEGLINTFEFRREGYATRIAQSEYRYPEMKTWLRDAHDHYDVVNSNAVITIRLPRNGSSQPRFLP